MSSTTLTSHSGANNRAACAGRLSAPLNRLGPRAEAAPGFSIVSIDFQLGSESDLLELVCSMTYKVGSEVIFGDQ